MKRSEGRILTSHSGSMFPPPQDGAGDRAAYFAATGTETDQVAETVRAVVDKQVEIGVDVINNGDQNRGLTLMTFPRMFDGLEQRPPEGFARYKGLPDEDMEVYAEYYSAHPFMPFDPGQCVCTGPVSPKGIDLLQRDLSTLADAAEGKEFEELFYCVISPGWLRRWIVDEHYGSEDDLAFALAEAVKPYYRAVVDAGMILQIDSPDVVDNWSWDRWNDVTAYRKDLEARLDALSNAIEGLPEERVRLHFCWGSWHGPHSIALPLEEVLDLVYTFPAQCYSIEAAKANHTHEWRAFEQLPLPDGKIVMPGVIDHTTPVIEHPQVIADRIVAYANVVGKENVIAGTDCGMRIDSRVEWAKLDRMVQGAQLASRELFR